MAQGIKRFTNVKNLKGLGRPLLEKCFERHQGEITACGLVLPNPELEDDPYFEALSAVFGAPKLLPEQLNEFLNVVVEMANDYGEARLKRAMAGVPMTWLDRKTKATTLDIVMQIGLEHPQILMEKHGEHRLVAMSSFQYYGTRIQPESRLSFAAATDEVLTATEGRLDRWFHENHRGNKTVRVRQQEMDGEWWYRIQHGGTSVRQATADEGRREIIHFRPDKEDVVVYSPERDEIRVHAGSAAEREVYQKEFGTFLRGDAVYFSARMSFTLMPLRTDVEAALSTRGIPGLRAVRLVRLEIDEGNFFSDRTVKTSLDMVKSAAQRSVNGRTEEVVPRQGKLIGATFELDFEGAKKPRKVQVRLPNGLSVGRHADAGLVQEWLSKGNFREASEEVATAKPRQVRPAEPSVPTAAKQPGLNTN